MTEIPHRRERKSESSVAPGPGRTTLWLRALLMAGLLAALVFAVVPGAQASTGGAESGVPAAVASEESTTTTASTFNEAELSFTPFRVAGASWYGGKTMWGRHTACGQILRPTTGGVANKTLS